MNEHQTWNRWRDGVYYAECSCGWCGPERDTASAALVDGHNHSKDDHPREESRVASACA